MGCDIHVMVEAKDFYCKRKGWFNVDHWRHNPDYGLDENERGMIAQPIFDARDYDTFAYLAGVRNYNGVTSFGFGRGLPEDVSAPTYNEYLSYGADAHTPGYATLAELKEKYSRLSYDEFLDAVRLEDLIDAIQDRKREIFHINDPGDRNYNQGNDCLHDDKIRIVFWFDN